MPQVSVLLIYEQLLAVYHSEIIDKSFSTRQPFV